MPLQLIILPKKPPWSPLKTTKKILEKNRENMWWHVPRFFQKTFMAMPASIAFILWNQRAGMNKRSPDARTSLDKDETLVKLHVKAFSLRGSKEQVLVGWLGSLHCIHKQFTFLSFHWGFKQVFRISRSLSLIYLNMATFWQIMDSGLLQQFQNTSSLGHLLLI